MNLRCGHKAFAENRPFRPAAAFTMIEIAIAMAVIGFALVAIIGVLPSGLNVQRDNREDTIINQDGTYFLEAIRSGSQGSSDLAKFVDKVDGKTGLNSTEIIGRLSVPYTNHTAEVRAISGPLAMQAIVSQNVAFSYLLRVEITNHTAVPNLYEVRLTFSWPLLPNGNTGSGRQVFRTLVGGYLAPSTNWPGLYFFQPQTFAVP